eukprot:scaffold7936_cov116-Isochrysis_galbana.AAC.6
MCCGAKPHRGAPCALYPWKEQSQQTLLRRGVALCGFPRPAACPARTTTSPRGYTRGRHKVAEAFEELLHVTLDLPGREAVPHIGEPGQIVVAVLHHHIDGALAVTLRILISRIAVMGNPSFSLSIRTRFSATISPVSLERALYTCPYVPSPTCSTFSYSLTLRDAPAGPPSLPCPFPSPTIRPVSAAWPLGAALDQGAAPRAQGRPCFPCAVQTASRRTTRRLSAYLSIVYGFAPGLEGVSGRRHRSLGTDENIARSNQK